MLDAIISAAITISGTNSTVFATKSGVKLYGSQSL